MVTYISSDAILPLLTCHVLKRWVMRNSLLPSQHVGQPSAVLKAGHPPAVINKLFKIAEELKDPVGLETPVLSSHLWCKVVRNMNGGLTAADT